MLTNRNIAFFIDLYNTELDSQHYDNIVTQLSKMGQIISGTVYGATERTHKEVLANADERGYGVVRTPRKRGRKTFDLRIIVDVVDKVSKSRGIDAVCIVAQPADLVYLFAFLRERGIKIITLANGEENSMALVDEVVDSGKVETLKLPKTSSKPKKAPVATPVVEPIAEAPAEPVVEEPTPVVEEPAPEAPAQPAPQPTEVPAEVSRMDELLREIDRLRAEVEQSAATSATQVPEEPVEEPVPAQPVAEPIVEPAPEAPVEPVVEQPAEEPVEAPAEPIVEPVAETPVEESNPQPRTAYVQQDDADLIRKIEQLRQGGADDETLIAEIKKLLDDID